MGKLSNALLVTASLLLGTVGVGLTASPAAAFWVDEARLNRNDAWLMDEPDTIKASGKDSQVFINEIDPTYVTRNGADFTPAVAKYEIAAPNGTDLTGWKFEIYEGSYTWLPTRDPYDAEYVGTVPLDTAFEDGPIFHDQQQGWGFKSFTAYAPKHDYLITKEANPHAHYVLVNPQGEIVQALAYRNEARLFGGTSRGRYTSYTTRGFSHLYRKGAQWPIGAEGSWKFNNVEMTPDSTYGSLQHDIGSPTEPHPLLWNWFTPMLKRENWFLLQPHHDRWNQINFTPEDLPTCAYRLLPWNQCAAHHIPAVGDSGYFFDVNNQGQDAIPPIADRADAPGSKVDILISDDYFAKPNISFDWLPKGVSYNPDTGRLTGTIQEKFDRRRIVLSAPNPNFQSTGTNGHGVTYRTFFWDGAITNNPPTIAFNNYTGKQGDVIDIIGEVTDADGDAITNVTMVDETTGTGLPKGFVQAGTNDKPAIRLDGTAESGGYSILVTATDARGATSTKEVSIVLTVGDAINLWSSDLTAIQGEPNKVPIFYNNKLTVKLDLAPGADPVPPGLFIDNKNNGFADLHTDGTTPTGVYHIRVVAQSGALHEEYDVTVDIRSNNAPPTIIIYNATVKAGVVNYIPTKISAVDPAKLDLVSVNNISGAPGFSLTTNSEGKGVLVIGDKVGPGGYSIKLLASDLTDPSKQTITVVNVKVEQSLQLPTAGIADQITATEGEEKIVDLDVNDPLGNAVSVAFGNEVPSSIVLSGGSLVIGDNTPKGEYEIKLVLTAGQDRVSTKTLTVKVVVA